VRDVRGERGPRLVPIGRLDYDTSGILLLTNDGDLAYALTHPRFGVEKLYRATVRGKIEGNVIERLERGVRLDGRKTTAARLRVVASRTDRSVVDVTLHEGRYRQVRRMFESVGHPVVALQRLRFGPIELGSLRAGRMRDLTPGERKALDALVRTSRK
jgi:23S rRNA pseudouridine2605 synthase